MSHQTYSTSQVCSMCFLLTPMRRKAHVTISMGSGAPSSMRSKWNAERGKDASREAVQSSNEGSDCDAPDNHDSDEVMNEKGRYAVRDDPATLKRRMTIPTPFETPMMPTPSKTYGHPRGHPRGHACDVTRSQNFPSPNKCFKAIVISFDKEKQNSDKSKVRREDESAIDFIRRQRDKNPMFSLMANLIDQRDELDREIERLKMHSPWKKQSVNDFIDMRWRKVMKVQMMDGGLNDNEALSEDDSLTGFIVDDEIDGLVQKAITPQQDTNACISSRKVTKHNSKNVKLPFVVEDEHPTSKGHKDKKKAEEKVDNGATLKPVLLTQALTIVKNLVYAQGIMELMTTAELWPGQVMFLAVSTQTRSKIFVDHSVSLIPLQKAMCMTFGIAQVTKSHMIELALGFYGMLFSHDIKDGGEMSVKNIRFSAFGDMSFSTRMSHTESNEMSSSYNAKLTVLLGEHSTSLRKAGPSMHSSPSEALPLFPKPVLGNLAIGDTVLVFDAPTTSSEDETPHLLSTSKMCPLHVFAQDRAADCTLVAVLHMANVWNRADWGDTMSFNILSVLLLLFPKS
ncbi:uncharacterized protein LAESUDRAFT_712610 [Laetiporus sulphureus 93-53]|uniref:Uncharacterized protein n=1 Tax=Laetiporus sulphureus 93-53 TaxID=1314785 RepID=A0A165FIW9_9APHY|nr:uncharacterized protein LAESUDRAFT_712610 [Laetiporus sulphureus 93-53]KZT09039.1 hypothetical protein LAESUDRAFT_712610 [Laetiporus sulphureus 93-53]